MRPDTLLPYTMLFRSAYLEFKDGTPATLCYNGYGYIQGWELVPWGETPGREAGRDAAYRYRRQLRDGTADEYEARELLRFGGRERGERKSPRLNSSP